MTPVEQAALAIAALEVRTAHDPTAQANGYNRCELCHYTRHPCDAFDMADGVLSLLDDLASRP